MFVYLFFTVLRFELTFMLPRPVLHHLSHTSNPKISFLMVDAYFIDYHIISLHEYSMFRMLGMTFYATFMLIVPRWLTMFRPL
jgi:hypothetical protein